MIRRAARPLLLAALLLCAWRCSHAAAPDLDVVWLSLAPLFALVLALVGGRYVGERTLARLAAHRHAARPRRLRASAPRPRRPPLVRVDGGGLLLARRLAGRAPPRVA